mgnify:CR=1 FL=1
MDKKAHLKMQGMALREIRESKTNYNISEVASILGKTRVWLSEIETGKKDIFFKDAKALCKIYGCSLDDLSSKIEKLEKSELI